MGELLRVTFGQQPERQRAKINYVTDGSLAVSGRSIEPPQGPQKKRHLYAVPSQEDTQPAKEHDAKEPFAGNPVSYDLDRRRRLREAKQPVVVASSLRTEPSYTPYYYVEPRPVVPEKRVVYTAPKVEKQKDPRTEFFYTKEWVQQEVEKVKQKPRNANETPWWHLKGTGFWVKEQIGQLVRNLQDVGKDAFPDVLELELSKVGEDFRHFEREYLMQLASLNWNLALQKRDGKMQIICPDYKGGGQDAEGALWSSVTSRQERDGKVYETLFGNEDEGTPGVQDWIVNALPKSKVVLSSAPGWSGFDNVTYPEAQIYVIEKQEDGSLKAFTFRYDANISQVESLQRKLGLTIPEAKDIRSRIKNTFANAALLTPEAAARLNIHGFEDIVDMMQESVGGREVAYGEGGGVKTFSEIKAFIKNPERFNGQHQMTDKLIERFKDYAKWRVKQGGSIAELTTDLEIAMAFNPLQLNQAYLMESESSTGSGYSGSGGGGGSQLVESRLIQQAYLAPTPDYESAKNKLEERPGCAGGGSQNATNQRYGLSSQYVLSMGAHRLIQKVIDGKSKGNEKDEQEWFSCSECGWKASGPIGESACGGCGFTKEQYAEKYGLVC